MTDPMQKSNAPAKAVPELTETQKAHLATIEDMKAKTKHLKFGTRLLQTTMMASTRVLRSLVP